MFNILPISRDEVFELRCNHAQRPLNPYHAGYFFSTTLLPKCYIQSNCRVPAIAKHVLTSTVENSVDLDQLASEKPADLDLHCFQTRILCV